MSEAKPSLEVEPQGSESRFGKIDRIVEAMLHGEITKKGTIEEVYPDLVIPDHVNRVDIVDATYRNINSILGVEIQVGKDKIRCIFKPLSGENNTLKRDEGLNFDFFFYPRECAAWSVSEHFGLDIVPPTTIREIDGDIGSLQLFLDPKYYKTYAKAEEEELVRAKKSKDWQKIGVLDWILANTERHSENMMLSIPHPEQLVAIDHGIILSSNFYAAHVVMGPSGLLTKREGEPIETDIPSWLLDTIKAGIDKRAELDEKLALIEGLESQEIENMWLRAQQLVDSGKFLSKNNFKKIYGRTWFEKADQE
jgi:hypothetical protein